MSRIYDFFNQPMSSPRRSSVQPADRSEESETLITFFPMPDNQNEQPKCMARAVILKKQTLVGGG